MNFLLEKVYPRKWVGWQNYHQIRTVHCETLEDYSKRRFTMKAKNRKTPFLESIIPLIPINRQFVISELIDLSGFEKRQIRLALWRMIQIGHPVSTTKDEFGEIVYLYQPKVK